MGLYGAERRDRVEEGGRKGRVKVEGLQGCSVYCDDSARSILPCLNAKNTYQHQCPYV